MMHPAERAAVLSEALPYIRQFSDKTVVVKYGGAAMSCDELKRAVISDIVLLSLTRINMVVVHGGGPEIDSLLIKTGKAPRFVDGLRHTDEETMDIVQMVLAGKIGKDLCALVGEMGGKAVSLCGIDGGILRAKQHSPELGLVGDITSVNVDLITAALERGYIPIISTVALGCDAVNPNGSYNVNADTAAGAIAAALKAERLVLLTDVRGVLKDPTDEASLVSTLSVSEIPELTRDGIITGGMIPKVACCRDAIAGGVKKAYILDGRLPHAILMEMFTDGGVGTLIHP
jgi:acetylglutamate kinase